MGFFDTVVTIDSELFKDHAGRKIESFQTKDLDPSMKSLWIIGNKLYEITWTESTDGVINLDELTLSVVHRLTHILGNFTFSMCATNFNIETIQSVPKGGCKHCYNNITNHYAFIEFDIEVINGVIVSVKKTRDDTEADLKKKIKAMGRKILQQKD